MVLHPSGNKELLFVETEEVYVSVKGSPDSIGLSDNKSVFVTCYNNDEIVTYENLNTYFKENKNYEVIIEAKKENKIEFYHENANIRESITPTGRNGRILSGIINFKSEVGYSDLVIKLNGENYLKLTLEILPGNLAYRGDYNRLIKEINDEIYNLAYGFLGRAYLGAEINNSKSGSYTEYYSILNYVYDRLMKAINIAMKNTNHGLIKESNITKYNGLKNTTKETIKWLEKRSYLINKINGIYVPEEALQVKKILTNDTNENRFLKFMLTRISKKLDMFIMNYPKSPHEKDRHVIKRLAQMRKELLRILNTTFLKDVSETKSNMVISHVFTMANGYKDIYKYYLMLQKGLSIDNNIVSLSIKELSVLYEYWCFIKMNTYLSKKYTLISTDFIKINRADISVALRKGLSSSIVYENPKTDERFEVSYYPEKVSKTINERPSIVISANKKGIVYPLEFIFDAKYNVDYSKEYKEIYGGVGPKEEDISKLHKYRDIFINCNSESNRNERNIIGAFVLFPYNNEEEYLKHPFYKSIEDVSIGGLPFLPSTTKLLEEFLETLINESAYSTLERVVDTLGKDEDLKENSFKNRNVLVGSLRNIEQFKVSINHNYYYIKSSYVNLAKHHIKYIALAQSKLTFKEEAGISYYGEVKNIKQIKRCDIKEIQSDSEESYYLFEVKNWSRLENKIIIPDMGLVRTFYTSEFLLKNSKHINELSILSQEEYRLWYELNRISNNAIINVNEENLSRENNRLVFSIKDTNITLHENLIRCSKSNDVINFNINDFKEKPRIIIEKILRFIDC